MCEMGIRRARESCPVGLPLQQDRTGQGGVIVSRTIPRLTKLWLEIQLLSECGHERALRVSESGEVACTVGVILSK